MQLSNLAVESEAARASAEAKDATARATAARLRYADYGTAEHRARQMQEQSRLLAGKMAKLEIVSPIAGRVVTPRVSDRLGAYVSEGTELAEIADVSTLRARVYVPEFEVAVARVGNPAILHVDSLFGSVDGKVVLLAPASTDIAPGLIEETPYKGIRPPTFYAALIEIPNRQNGLRIGMTGTAKIKGERRSIAGLTWQEVKELLARKLW